jgi:hypothetical protein
MMPPTTSRQHSPPTIGKKPKPLRRRRYFAASTTTPSTPLLAAQACTGTTRVNATPVTAALNRAHHFAAEDMAPSLADLGKTGRAGTPA